MAATTKTMGLSNVSGKKNTLPAGGPRVQNVISKGGLPTAANGQNHSCGTGK